MSADGVAKQLDRLTKMYELAIWAHNGQQFLPVWGYGELVEVYMPAKAAIAIFNQDMQRALGALP